MSLVRNHLAEALIEALGPRLMGILNRVPSPSAARKAAMMPRTAEPREYRHRE